MNRLKAPWNNYPLKVNADKYSASVTGDLH